MYPELNRPHERGPAASSSNRPYSGGYSGGSKPKIRHVPIQMECENPEECKDWLALFRRFDRDRDGFIPLSELRQYVAESAGSFGLKKKEQDDLLANVDRNGDHLVDFPEFSILIGIYIYYVVKTNYGISISGPVPTGSPLIYNPYRKEQVWRFLTYMFIHIGLAQIIIGIPLELVHKPWRIAIVYLLGVLAGSLAVSVSDPCVYLAGASGGVYALIAAHVANLVVNWSEMEFAIIRTLMLIILIGADVGVAIYNRYSGQPGNKVSYVAHIGGFIAGLLMGIVVLRNFKKKTWERVVWWIALVGFIILLILCIIYNIVSEFAYKPCSITG